MIAPIMAVQPHDQSSAGAAVGTVIVVWGRRVTLGVALCPQTAILTATAIVTSDRGLSGAGGWRDGGLADAGGWRGSRRRIRGPALVRPGP